MSSPPSAPSSRALALRWKRCVDDVGARGTAADPYAVCTAALRRAYGSAFVRADRARRRGAFENPQTEVLQTRRLGPDLGALEWVSAAAARWMDAARLGPRRPPRAPGRYLVAPGLQLVVAHRPDGRGADLTLSRALFVRHGHRWTFLRSAAAPAYARAMPGGRVVAAPRTRLAEVDRASMAAMVAYLAQVTRAQLAAAR